MNIKRLSKNKLSLALAAALVGGLAVNNAAHAVYLDSQDRLGDAVVYQYFTAKQPWQTFFRLINTSDDAVVVKVRFREAANSREILDFEVALSPRDMWTAWTSADPTNDGMGPGIRTNDTSCVFPPPDTSPLPGEGFVTVDPDTNLIAAHFKDRAFIDEPTYGGYYDDGAGLDSLVRMSEGHLEVIGIAQYNGNQGNGNPAQGLFVTQVSHNGATGKPNDCQGAFNSFYNGAEQGNDVEDILAANAYIINAAGGQGAGYDPDVLAYCSDESLTSEARATDTSPDLDNCDPRGLSYTYPEVGDVALNQRLWDGTMPSPVTATFSQVDLNRDDVISDDADPALLANVDLNGDGVCDGDEVGIAENNVPQSVYDAALDTSGPDGTSAQLIQTTAGGCTNAIVASGGDLDWLASTRTEQTIPPWRLKQKGRQTFAYDPTLGWPSNVTPVTGGVDAVSREFMRRSVINEWAASFNPDSIVLDYYTQWILTFPTKHYYVDLQDDDPVVGDDISPTLYQDNLTEAFAPFSAWFQGGGVYPGNVPGMSCEPYRMKIWNREERSAEYTSPAPAAPEALCYETNVLTFNERYLDRGLESGFGVTVDQIYLPTDYDGQVSERGWAELTFTGPGTYVGLSNRHNAYLGLPVTGFMFSVYNLGSAAQNHTTINAHKYTRDIDDCNFDPEDGICRDHGGEVPTP